MKTKSRLCTYGSACGQENRYIVYIFLTQSTSLQCQQTHQTRSPFNTGVKTSVRDSPHCIRKKKLGFLRPFPFALRRSTGQGKPTVQISFSKQFLNKISCGWLTPVSTRTARGGNKSKTRHGQPEAAVSKTRAGACGDGVSRPGFSQVLDTQPQHLVLDPRLSTTRLSKVNASPTRHSKIATHKPKISQNNLPFPLKLLPSQYLQFALCTCGW